MDNRVFFCRHCLKFTRNQHHKAKLISQTFICQAYEFFLLFCKTYSRQIVQSGTQAGSPHRLQDIAIVKNMPKQFTKF